MLVIARKPNQTIRIGDALVTVLRVRHQDGARPEVRLGIVAPPDVKVLRKELEDREQAA